MERDRDQHQHQNRRDRQADIDHSPDHSVDPSTEIGGQQAEDRPDRDPDEPGGESDVECLRCADDHHRQQVPCLPVGSQRMVQRRLLIRAPGERVRPWEISQKTPSQKRKQRNDQTSERSARRQVLVSPQIAEHVPERR